MFLVMPAAAGVALDNFPEALAGDGFSPPCGEDIVTVVFLPSR